MKVTLLDLLESLETIGNSYGELYDSEVRERMGVAIMEAFVRQRADYVIPDDLGMFSEPANRVVHSAIQRYIVDANRKAKSLGLLSFYDRLNALQDSSVQTANGRNDYEEFLGHTPPEFHDTVGNVIRFQ